MHTPTSKKRGHTQLKTKKKLGFVMKTQATIWYHEGRFNEAKIGVLDALKIFERLGVVENERDCKDLLQVIEQATKSQSTSL